MKEAIESAAIAVQRDRSALKAKGYTRLQMIQFLSKAIAPATKEDIRKKIMANPKMWYAPYHFGWGNAIRNDLRAHGFTEAVLGIKSLDNVYVELIEEAVKR